MPSRRSKLVLIGCIAAGVIIGSSTRAISAGGFSDPLLPGHPDALQTGLNADTSWQFLSLFEQDRLSSSKFSGSLSAGAVNFGVNSDFHDTTKIDGNSFLGFVMGNNAKWQQNQVGYTDVTADMGETFRVKTRF